MKTMTQGWVKLAPVFGMDVEARSALWRLEELAKEGPMGVAGRFMPDAGVSGRLAGMGVTEEVEEVDFFRYRRIVIPFGGIAPQRRRRWENAGAVLVDLTSPQVRRAQVALGLLRTEGAQPLVIGRHGDPESEGLVEGNPGALILQDTTDTARLRFSPKFAGVCQTTLSPRKVSWLVQQLRHRWKDAEVTFLETLSPAMASRDRALENLMERADRVVIVGSPGEASCEALAETALRKGKACEVVEDACGAEALEKGGRIALTAGAFTLDSTIRGVADVLMGK